MRAFSPTLMHTALAVLFALNAYMWTAVLHPQPHTLRVSVLDIGQGDSILVQSPDGVQMLIDGGPDRSVLRQLPREIGLLDRSLDLVVETHPDADHISGLSDVFRSYGISYFMSPGIPNDTSQTAALESAAAHERGLQQFTARRGMRIHLGSDAYADVLYPDHDVSKGETNEGSIVMHLVYGTTSFMLTGDAPSDIEDHLIELAKGEAATSTELKSDVLKAGHHGSKYSTDDAWLAAVHPSYVAISAGEGNRYGHPNPETLGRIKEEGAQILSTIDRGTIRFESDGTNVWQK